MDKLSANNLFNLRGRKALVTGGSKGIGKAISRGLALAGAEVSIVCRDTAIGETALADISAGLEVKGKLFTADLSSRSETLALAEQIRQAGGVDIFVHSAGSNVRGALSEIEDEDWDNLLELNLTSAMILVRALSPQMAASAWGRIIFISSIYGIASREERASYSATKAGLIGFMKTAALELGPSGVTVNCLAPGHTETELSAHTRQSDLGKYYATQLALRRWGKPEELVGPALLLASNAGSFITGSTLVVDGGALSRAI